MADSTSKKAKIMLRSPRIRYTIQLEVKAGMEDRLEQVKSRLQQVKSGLYITNRTPLGNFMMIEELLDAFEERRNTQMVSSPGFFQLPVHRVNPSTIEHLQSRSKVLGHLTYFKQISP